MPPVKLIHKILGWLLSLSSLGMGLCLIGFGAPIPGLISLGMAVAVFPLFDLPFWVQAIALVLALVVL